MAFYNFAVEILAVCALFFLGNLNLVLYRLSTMLPDENLREETRQFTLINRLMVLGILVFAIAFGDVAISRMVPRLAGTLNSPGRRACGWSSSWCCCRWP